MPDGSDSVLLFGPFRLFPAQRRLEKDGKPLRLGGRALDILTVLAERAGEVVSNRALLESVWQDVTVEESSLRFHIKNLRKILGDGQSGTRYVSNVPGRGYCFVATTTRINALESSGDQPAARRYALPRFGTQVIGRESVIDALVVQLAQRGPLTIVGPGGIGKSTVALALAHARQADYQHGVCFVDLAPLSDPSLVLAAVAAALELPLPSGDPSAALIGFLRDKQILLILDSCEHVVDSVAILSEVVLDGAPAVGILATSREPLGTQGEQVHRLAPLELPPETAHITSQEALSFSAIQLFVARAGKALAEFGLTDANTEAVVDICRKLDGMPLAIELATSRIDVLGASGLLTRLGDRFRLLSHGQRTSRGRHRTLHATLAWSYDFLEPDEQVVLRRLAIFTGAFGLKAAQSVVAFDGLPASEVIDHIANLATKSLVVAKIGDSGAIYRLLDTTRAYALEKLVAAGEADQVARQHVAWVLEALSPAEREISSASATTLLDDHRRLIGDVRSALDWAFSPDGNSMMGAAVVDGSVSLWLRHSLVSECRRWVEHALASCVGMEPSLRMRLMAARAIVLLYTSRGTISVEMQEAWTGVLEIARQLGDVKYSLRALWGLWAFEQNVGPLPEALNLARRYCDLAMRSGNAADLATGDRILGMTLDYLGDLAGAEACFERSLARLDSTSHASHAIDFQYDQSLAARAYMPKTLWLRGRPDAALWAARSAVDDAVAVGHALSLCLVLMKAACPVALLVGDIEAARHFVDMLLSTSTTHAIDLWHTEGSCFSGAVLARGGKPHEGRGLLLRAMNGPPYMWSNTNRIEMLIELAQAFACTADFQQGIDVLDEALADSARREERWCIAELLRMKAEMLLNMDAPGSQSYAEELLQQSLEWARSQGALSWELRAASSLARLRLRQGQAQEGRTCLEPVYARFTEGFDTADLTAARQLLDGLDL
jgi:predicted ATPase/DNA-binding winged helix-turn-helix (wHTH) protein